MVNATRRAGPVWVWALGVIVLLVIVWVLLAARSAAAQQPDVLRQAFPFVGTALNVQIQVDVPGTLNVIRGDPGRIDLAARALDGLAASGLARKPRHQLNITATGASRVDFMLVVPAGVRVEIRLPDRPVVEVFGTLQDGASYAWEATAPPAGAVSAGTRH